MKMRFRTGSGIAAHANHVTLPYCVADFDEVSAKVATQVKQVRVSDTGEMAEATAPDNIILIPAMEVR